MTGQRRLHYWPRHAASPTAPARRTTWVRLFVGNLKVADRALEFGSGGFQLPLKLGDPQTAAKTGEALDLAALPVGLVGRHTRVNLDLTRAYAMSRKDAAAVNLLLAAERFSPQLVRYD